MSPNSKPTDFPEPSLVGSACNQPSDSIATSARRPVLVLVEGVHDVEFLSRISAIMHRENPCLPDLQALGTHGQLIFLPIGGGGDLEPWITRLAALGLPEVHIYDRELPPVTQLREGTVAAINVRPRCRAYLTRKRNLENYLHAEAVREATGITITITDNASVAECVAQQSFAVRHPSVHWDELTPRARKRLCNGTKHTLNTLAVDCMTATRLAQRDPVGEVRSWLGTIGRLARGT